MKAVAIGELAVDWISLERGPDMMTATKFYRNVGGNATNVAIGLARLGVAAALISKVGEDIHGDYLLACLHKEAVDTTWVVKAATQPTAQCYMTRSDDGFPEYHAWPSPNASKTLGPEDLKPESYEQSWIWHAAAVSFIAKPRRFALLHAMMQANAANKIISFDACFPLVESGGGRQAAWQVMLVSDIIRFNRAELAYWSRTCASIEADPCISDPYISDPSDSDPSASDPSASDPRASDPRASSACYSAAYSGIGSEVFSESDVEAMVDILLEKLSPTLLVVTLAEEGAVLYCAGKKSFCPVFPVESIGDVGPGDAFSAGLIYGLTTLGGIGMNRETLRKLNLEAWERLARYGACTGAMVTRSHSATESFPSLGELRRLMGETPPEA